MLCISERKKDEINVFCYFFSYTNKPPTNFDDIADWLDVCSVYREMDFARLIIVRVGVFAPATGPGFFQVQPPSFHLSPLSLFFSLSLIY